jgi:hypothetical protein
MSLSREARGLVDAARREAGGPTQEQRTRMRRAVMVAVGAVAGATATTGTAAAAIATAPAGGLMAKIGIGAVMVALVSGGVALLSRNDEAPVTPRAATTASTSAASAVASAQPLDQEAAPTAAPPEATAITTPSAAPPVVMRSATSQAAASGKSDGLAEELVLVRTAQDALRAGNHSEALVSLDRYAKRIPKGQLGYEAAALRAIALCGVGRKQDGRAILKAMPESGSPMAARIDDACK